MKTPEHAHGEPERAAGHPLDRVLDALLDIVGRAGRRAARHRAVLEMEMRVVGVEKCGIEAAVQPAAPLAMQGRRKEVPTPIRPASLSTTSRTSEPALARSDAKGRGLSGAVEIGDRVHELAGRFGEPDPGLAGKRGERRRSPPSGPRLPASDRTPSRPASAPRSRASPKRASAAAAWRCRDSALSMKGIRGLATRIFPTPSAPFLRI